MRLEEAVSTSSGGIAWPVVIIGGHAYRNGTTSSQGAAFVYSGAWIALKLGQAQLHRFNGSAGSNSGFAVTGLGDINGDGKSDLAVSEIGHQPVPGIRLGRVQIYNGSDGKVIASILGQNQFSNFGFSMDRSDVDGDKINDLIIGAEGVDEEAFARGVEPELLPVSLLVFKADRERTMGSDDEFLQILVSVSPPLCVRRNSRDKIDAAHCEWHDFLGLDEREIAQGTGDSGDIDDAGRLEVHRGSSVFGGGRLCGP